MPEASARIGDAAAAKKTRQADPIEFPNGLLDRGMEVSGYHHNVRGDFLMRRQTLYAAGTGEARFRGFRSL